MGVSAAAYNRLVDLASRLYPVRFVHQPLNPARGQHAWQVYRRTDELGRAGLCLTPGLVNGQFAYVNLPFRSASLRTQERLKREAAEADERMPEGADTVRVPLDEEPFLQPRWRPVDPSEPTKVLQRRTAAQLTAGGIVATEVILTTNRTAAFAVTESVDQGDGTVLTSVNVGYRVVEGSGFEVQCVENFQPPKDEFSAADIFFNRYREPEVGQVKIATIYAAVPPGLGGELTDSWQIAAQPDVYHNLAYAESTLPPATVPRGLTFVTPLGLGLANTAASLTSNNQASADALSFLAANRTRGLYYAV